MTRLTTKTSTIFVATGHNTRVFHSLDAVPPDLRRRIEESTHSLNSTRILIADKRGREELVRALRDQQKETADGVISSLDSADRGHAAWLPSFRTWVELLLPVGIAGALWAFLGARF